MSSRREIENVCRRLVGRTIRAVEANVFHTDNAGVRSGSRSGWTSDPVLVLDDGSRLSFVVDETETGQYGISLCLSKPGKGGG